MKACVNVEKGHGHDKIKNSTRLSANSVLLMRILTSCVINIYKEETSHYKTLFYFDTALNFHPLFKQLSIFVGLWLSPRIVQECDDLLTLY